MESWPQYSWDRSPLWSSTRSLLLFVSFCFFYLSFSSILHKIRRERLERETHADSTAVNRRSNLHPSSNTLTSNTRNSCVSLVRLFSAMNFRFGLVTIFLILDAISVRSIGKKIDLYRLQCSSSLNIHSVVYFVLLNIIVTVLVIVIVCDCGYYY